MRCKNNSRDFRQMVRNFGFTSKLHNFAPLIKNSGCFMRGNVSYMQNLNAFRKLFSSPKRIVITPHSNPDADALGSALALSSILMQQGHDVHVVSPNDCPGFLKWMKGESEVVVYDQQPERCIELLESANIIFSLDYSCLDRVGPMGDIICELSATNVIIDHHRSPEDYADFMEWDVSAGATAELIFDLAKSMDWLKFIDPDVADCLYAGILTDTGGFKHPNTSKHIHEIVAELIGMGAHNSKVSKLIYDSNSLDRLRLLGFALNDRLVVREAFRVAYIYLSAEDLARFNSQKGDTEGLVNYALSITGITMAALFTEKDGLIKISFRSVGDFSVNDFARANFEGGGHTNAAGGKSDLTLQETLEKFEGLLPQYKDELITTEQKLYA